MNNAQVATVHRPCRNPAEIRQGAHPGQSASRIWRGEPSSESGRVTFRARLQRITIATAVRSILDVELHGTRPDAVRRSTAVESPVEDRCEEPERWDGMA